MLCYPFEEKRLKKWKPPYIIQPKLDGDRCRAIIDDSGQVTLLTSEENIVRSVPHIVEAIESLHLHSIELDGELYIHGAPHSDIHGIVSRSENLHPNSDLMEYHVFDIVNHLPQINRTNLLLDTIPFRQTGRTYSVLQIVPSRVVSTLDEIMSVQEEFAKEGYEGFVIRNIEAPYVRKRSTGMMKFKPRKEDIYEIVGFQEEISKEGVLKNSLGALLCKGDDRAMFSVGSGSLLTQEARSVLWKEKENLIGKYARVKYQHLTHARGVPRFPVIVEIIDTLC
jgi:ATP-dependent DNA ligase